ncbi:homoserine kinase [Wenzhouxiangella sp. EGI_FJ10305]|uniref:homoserine kinase n=1 Tax=Wenzhouxiangella sp. EGI_FJ10305 TaxID=3243768 RepID=UPI0035DEEA21
MTNNRTATTTATATAPACVGNVAVGFDLLGHAIEGPGDRVTARLANEPGVRIVEITGVATDLPTACDENTASRAVASLLADHAPDAGIELLIDKGIPLASGLAGSAASAVAAVVAANALLDEPLAHSALYPYALEGERVASGADCGDNVGPQLLGGLLLAAGADLIRIPVPDGLTAVVVTPEMTIETRATRQALEAPFKLTDITAAQANLARVLAGCYGNDLDLIRAGLKDVLVEPRRAGLIPGFETVKQAALDHQALGASLSGSGPSVFAWFGSAPEAHVAAPAMVEAFEKPGLAATAIMSPVDAPGARLA